MYTIQCIVYICDLYKITCKTDKLPPPQKFPTNIIHVYENIRKHRRILRKSFGLWRLKLSRFKKVFL